MLTKEGTFCETEGKTCVMMYHSTPLHLPCHALISSIYFYCYTRCLPLSAQGDRTQGDRTQGDGTLDESSHTPSTYVGQPLTFSQLIPTATVDDTPALKKYWSQRYRLFSKYDEGICMDNGEYFVESDSLLVVISKVHVTLE